MDEVKLTEEENLELCAFRTKYTKDICFKDGVKCDGRRDMFLEAAKKEILYLRNVNEQRALLGKEPIAKADRKLVFQEGVVSSIWRCKERENFALETSKAAREAALDTLKANGGR